MRSRKGSDIVINIGSTKELGELIMHERKAQGLTQTQLAGLSGVGITFLSNLENGKQTAELGKRSCNARIRPSRRKKRR